MLHQVLNEIESARGTISLRALALKLNIEESALEGMLSFWVRKGRLKADEVFGDLDGAPVCQSSGCSGCAGVTQCPFVVQTPRVYEVKLKA